MDLLSIFLAAFGIGLLIFVHELGHFVAARAAGVRVEVFSLGFGPRLCGVVWRGTDFRLSLVPFGGYVLVAGADPSDRRYPPAESLYAKSIAQRALFWSGGVVMNVLFALVAFPIVFGVGVSFLAPIVGSVEYGSPAWEVGLSRGDRIVSIDGRRLLSLDNLAAEVALHGHRPVELLVRRGEEELVLQATPRFDRESGLYQLGVGAAYGDFTIAVAADGPAHAAGLRDGDALVALGGTPVGDGRGLVAALSAGGPLAVEARRGDEVVRATITSPTPGKALPPRIGVEPLPRRVLGLRPGAPIVARLGLAHDDVVLAVDGRPFLGGDLGAFVTGPARLSMHVLRGGRDLVLEADATAADRAALATHVALGNDGSMRLSPRPDSPAAAAGLRAADLVETVDGAAIADWNDLKKAVEGSKGAALRFGVRRLSPDATGFFDAERGDLPRGELVELVITPRRESAFDYGFAPSAAQITEEVRAEGVGDALRLGVVCSFDLLKQSYVTLKRMLTGDVGAQNLGGIIRISEFSYRAAQRGPSWFWYFLGLISVNLAFVNLLPIPVLDGGHMLFLLIEKVKGSPVSSRVFGYSQVVGLVFVLLLVLFVTYNDIMRHL